MAAFLAVGMTQKRVTSRLELGLAHGKLTLRKDLLFLLPSESSRFPMRNRVLLQREVFQKLVFFVKVEAVVVPVFLAVFLSFRHPSCERY